MKIFHSKKQLAAFFMPGFLLGIIYMNFFAGKYMAEPGVFSEYFLNQFQTVHINAKEYIWYLLKVRIIPIVILYVLSNTRVSKFSVIAYVLWTGITGGVFVSSAVENLGIKGSFLCMVAVFPQFFFYIPAYIVLLWYCYNTPRSTWNRQKTVFVFLCTAVGMILELYINPVLVKAFLSVL